MSGKAKKINKAMQIKRRRLKKEMLGTIKKANRGEDLFGPFKNFDEMMKFINA